MKLLIIGSRGISDFNPAPYVPSNVDIILSEASSAIGTAARGYAKERGITFISVDLCDYSGRGAENYYRGLVDNCDAILLVWDCQSQECPKIQEIANEKGVLSAHLIIPPPDKRVKFI